MAWRWARMRWPISPGLDTAGRSASGCADAQSGRALCADRRLDLRTRPLWPERPALAVSPCGWQARGRSCGDRVGGEGLRRPWHHPPEVSAEHIQTRVWRRWSMKPRRFSAKVLPRGRPISTWCWCMATAFRRGAAGRCIRPTPSDCPRSLNRAPDPRRKRAGLGAGAAAGTAGGGWQEFRGAEPLNLPRSNPPPAHDVAPGADRLMFIAGGLIVGAVAVGFAMLRTRCRRCLPNSWR